jgi:hypothetical protein
MNPQLALYLAQVHQSDLRNTAARCCAAGTASTPSWFGRFRRGAIRWQRQPVASATRATPVASRASATR